MNITKKIRKNNTSWRNLWDMNQNKRRIKNVMKNKTMIEWLQELPEDYELCFSEYTSFVEPSDEDKEEYFVVLDMPIVGIIKNDDCKEIRFFTEKSEEHVIREIEKGVEWKRLE